MSGLREKRKQQNQRNIIAAAREIFAKKGFKNATMAEIAVSAEVGTGTTYNYYPSKGALLLAVFTEEMNQFQVKETFDSSALEGDVIQIIMKIMEGLTRFFSNYSKEFWREIMHVMTEEAEESISIRKGLFGLDEELMNWLSMIIKQYSDSFLFPVDPLEATMAIYSVSITQTMLFIYNDAMTFEQLIEQLQQQIQFVFSGKLKDTQL